MCMGGGGSKGDIRECSLRALIDFFFFWCEVRVGLRTHNAYYGVLKTFGSEVVT